MKERVFYLIFPDDHREGPLPESVVRRRYRQGALPGACKVWCAGMPKRLPLAEVLAESPAPQPSPPPQPRPQTPQPPPLPAKKEPADTFSFSAFCAEMFRRHSVEEAVELFCCGTRTTTPPFSMVRLGWPSPWLFSRIFLLSVLLVLGFGVALALFENIKLVPGLMFVGNFALPFCTVVLFFELNVQRDIAFYHVMKGIFVGGLLALLAALVLFSVSIVSDWAPLAGVIEEPAKLAAVLLVAGELREKQSVLAGLLLGAAVGAGFAAFESAGYTFEAVCEMLAAYLQGEEAPVNPHAVMLGRALLAPFCHTVWTAVTAGAFWYVMHERRRNGRAPGGNRFDFGALADIRFLRWALVPVVLHMVWNSALFAEEPLFKYLSLGAVGWFFALRLAAVGYERLREMRRA